MRRAGGMSFTVVNGREDHELDDAIRRGVAIGLVRLLEVPRHPASVQAVVDEHVRAERDRAESLAQTAVNFASGA